MTSWAIGFVLLAGLFAWTVYAPATVRFVVEGILWLIAALLGAEFISGIARILIRDPLVPGFHRWTGHLLVSLCWLVMAASVVLSVRHFQQRRGTSILFLSVSLAALVLINLASFTGYLRPLAPGTLEETKNRFLVLHCVALPSILAVIVPVWILMIRRLRSSSPTREITTKLAKADNGAMSATSIGPPDDNPYSSPRGD